MAEDLMPSFPEKAVYLYRSAAKHGHVEILEWLLGKNIPWAISAVRLAAAAGHIHVLRWVIEKKLQLPFRESLSQCALSGNLEVLQWAKAKDFDLKFACVWASAMGHVHVLEWLVGEGGEKFEEGSEAVTRIFPMAAEGGHVAVLQWIGSRTRTK
jgi:hypothetical protein